MSLRNLNVVNKIPKQLKDNFKNPKIVSIYKKFERNLNIKENFIVAVSGGPDSLALAFLAKIYSIKKGLNIKFLIVNHKLRTDSTKEAKTVKKVLKKFGIDLKILNWNGRKPIKNIQSLARNKRYDLLFNESKKYNIDNILLGHHQDDLFENFFIRLLRGSGLKGLISLDKKVQINGKNLLRPLIDQSKENLIYITKNVFNFYVEDPTNNDEKYKRIIIRHLIEQLKKNGLDKKKFRNTISNLKYSDNVIKFYVSQNIEKNSFFLKKKRKIDTQKRVFRTTF